MDKNAIKKYAVWARRELIDRVSQKAKYYGITEEEIESGNADSVRGVLLSPVEKKQRRALISEIKKNGYQQVMEAVAYTWFNRFSALRFMEVNGYLPTRVRVFTDANNAFNPQILTEALHLDLDGLDQEKVIALKQANQTEELYRYLLITQCNALSDVLPGMFQRIEDYTELLLPDHLLRDGSIIEQLVTCIPEEDWKEQVQIIGWLYQYYNTELKDKVFADLKKNIKVDKNSIPAATQLFTPHWIVQYMVENSLGRLWIEHEMASQQSNFTWGDLRGEKFTDIDDTRFGPVSDAGLAKEFGWKYYLPEAEQEEAVKKELQDIRKTSFAALSPEDIKVIDPCCGSGHILVYMFDVLMQIYERCGYSTQDAVSSIVRNNLHGLDIDDRAAQLAYFAVMMTARKYDRRFFSRGIQPHVFGIQESNGLDYYKEDMGDFLLPKEHQETLHYLMRTFVDAKIYGSTLRVEDRDYLGFLEAWEYTSSQTAKNINMILWYDAVKNIVPQLAWQAILLTQKYHVVATNPPYMGGGNMSSMLSEFIKKNYPDTKSDLSTVFMERTLEMCSDDGVMAMINIPVWMFLSSYEKLRNKIINENTILSMVHPGRGIFGSDFGTTTFIIGKAHIPAYAGQYRRLFEKQGEVETVEEREQRLLEGKGQFTAKQSNFSKIPGTPVAYWVSEAVYSAYSYPQISTIAFSDGQILTGNNERYLRFLWEVNSTEIDRKERWVLHAKGGEQRRWYGNIDTVVSWTAKSIEHYKNDSIARFPKDYVLFRKGITWSLVSSSDMFSMRILTENTTFNKAAATILFHDDALINYVLGYLNSKVTRMFLRIMNPTLNTNIKDILSLPIAIEENKRRLIENRVQDNIAISRADWDSFETSWNFQQHPIVRLSRGVFDCTEVAASMTHLYGFLPKVSCPLEICFLLWQGECNDRFKKLKDSEEELNRIFIDIYGLQGDLTPEVEDKDVTVRQANLGRDIRSLISYAVGCMFGRYSLDAEGLILAGQEYSSRFVTDPQGYSFGESVTLSGDYIRMSDNSDDMRKCSFVPDKDNIIPICDDEYFEDDIVNRFTQWLEVVFGKESLEANLDFIANALGGKGTTSRQVIRDYFLNGFYADHLKIYQKRPIYWLFDSGKKNGFKALIYMHRYQPHTLARLRTDYVHEQQARYRTAIESIQARLADASTGERVRLNKQLAKLQAQADEIYAYEQKVHHLADQMIPIDLDDGVRHNYAIFQDVLAKIK